MPSNSLIEESSLYISSYSPRCESLLTICIIFCIFFKRFLHIDEKTLRVANTGGLQGGGACVPREKTANVIKESPEIIIIKSKSINKRFGERSLIKKRE